MSPLLKFTHDSVSTHKIVATDAIAVQLTPVKHVAYIGEVFDVSAFAFIVVVDIHSCFPYLHSQNTSVSHMK
jgi:hypothetical protein